jgi:hypothetical protein
MPISFGKGNGGDGDGKESGGPSPDMPYHAVNLAKDMAETVGPKVDLNPTMFVPMKHQGIWGIGIVPLPGDRQDIGPAALAVLKKFEPPWYVFLWEAWVAQRNKPLPPGKRVSDLPLDDREEWILVFLIQRKKGVIHTEECKVTRLKGQRSLSPWGRKGEYIPVSQLMPTDW